MPPTFDYNLDEIIRGCLERKINLILPTRDGELDFYSRNQNKFEKVGIKIICASNSTINYCLDKLEFFKIMKEQDVPVVPTSLTCDSDFGERVTVKERFGSGSKKMIVGIKRQDVVSYSNNLDNPIYQPTIRGEEFSIDVWASLDGSKILTSPRIRSVIQNGEAKITKIFKNDQLVNVTQKIVKILNLQGIAVVQGFITSDKRILINECNARFGGATTATTNAGGYILDLVLLDFLGISTTKLFSSIEIKEITQVRASFDSCF
jgi:carbamoyl-phosphate synthase large subunit